MSHPRPRRHLSAVSPLIDLLTQARAAGLTLTRDGTRLAIDGAQDHAHLARQLRARQQDALQLVDVYTGVAPYLDWRSATVAEHPARCVLCRRWALLSDPYDHQPMHKVCAETRIRPHPIGGE